MWPFHFVDFWCLHHFVCKCRPLVFNTDREAAAIWLRTCTMNYSQDLEMPVVLGISAKQVQKVCRESGSKSPGWIQKVTPVFIPGSYSPVYGEIEIGGEGRSSVVFKMLRPPPPLLLHVLPEEQMSMTQMWHNFQWCNTNSNDALASNSEHKGDPLISLSLCLNHWCVTGAGARSRTHRFV